jgi:hypothetical protein
MLKKKTQELEKFKFVLDYKIKDLKRDIAPREAQINKLKRDTRFMDDTLRTCCATNQALGFTVDDLRKRQEEMQDLIKSNLTRIRNNDIEIQGFKNNLYDVVRFIDDHSQLEKALLKSLYPAIKNTKAKNVEIDPDIKKEYVNQRKYLESSHHSLQKRLEKEDQIHR